MRRRIVVLSLLLVGSGCEVDPYCLSCDDGSVPDDSGMDGGRVDGGRADGSLLDAPIQGDAGPDACLENELCNELDDDCDGFVDEGFELDTNPEHCGACDVYCSAAHAFGVCTAGVCGLGDCDVGFYDLDGDPENGCEYRCSGTQTNDVICDLRDDDCDGMVDEDVPFDTDPVNCGRCGRVCNAAHSAASCELGACALGTCDPGFYDLDGRADTGCEYACTPADPLIETCNSRDDDCDGLVDEGDPGGGVACGSDEGSCVMGLTECGAGRVVCIGEVRPSTELCNGGDDDCDTRIDEGNPEGGRVCGTSVGACDVGAERCVGGSLVCMDAVVATAELCNNIDDDCDGVIDNGNPGGGAACGDTDGACTAGTITCRTGALVCEGGIRAVAELCNGVDDDCDTIVDEGDPGGGGLCGTDVGTCSPGTFACTGGSLVCMGQVAASVESCNGQDDDCDGSVDEANPEGGAACGETAGECSAGLVTCRSGVLACEGATLPRVETCNGLNDDCDLGIDEDFSLMTDVANCGVCGRVCNLPNAIQQCSAGSCVIAGCRSGFVDVDPGAPGCEYACSFSGAEICNGVDDDCDGVVDEGLLVPAGFCDPNGVCGGTAATCGGAAGWECVYGVDFEESETRCDGLDNDCDGFVDELFPNLGDACGNGTGTCRRGGVVVCRAAEDGVECSAPAAGAPGDEECNGLDDDCDGSVDERVPDDPGTAWRDGVDVNAIDTVSVDIGGMTVEVMAYEASRPDATALSAGSNTAVACSRADVKPWTNVTWDQAQNACCALNASGECPTAGGSGWRLCEAPDWQSACEGPTGTCDYSYGTMCSMSQDTACNGAEWDCNGAVQGDQDCLYTTGSPTFPMCFTDWGIEGDLYDMSGNVREWTATNRGGDLFEVRGGSYNHIEAGRACDWNFTVARRTDSTPNTGFRCCMY